MTIWKPWGSYWHPKAIASPNHVPGNLEPDSRRPDHDANSKLKIHVESNIKISPDGPVFYPLSSSEVQITEDCKSTIVFYFHGLTADGKYSDSAKNLITWINSELGGWLKWLENDGRVRAKVYVASYEQYAMTGQTDLYALGSILFGGVEEVREKHRDVWHNCHFILIGHSVGGLAIKQLILEAESRHDVPSLSFLRGVVGIFYFSTPHSDSADLTHIHGRSKSQVGASLAALGRVTQRLNHQFMDRRGALGIPTAAVFEGRESKVGGFNDFVVSERSARMDVDIALKIVAKDHFNICKITKENDKRYLFLLEQIDGWVRPSSRSRVADAELRTSENKASRGVSEIEEES